MEAISEPNPLRAFILAPSRMVAVFAMKSTTWNVREKSWLILEAYI
jgi:hypothetical protein